MTRQQESARLLEGLPLSGKFFPAREDRSLCSSLRHAGASSTVAYTSMERSAGAIGASIASMIPRAK